LWCIFPFLPVAGPPPTTVVCPTTASIAKSALMSVGARPALFLWQPPERETPLDGLPAGGVWSSEAWHPTLMGGSQATPRQKGKSIYTISRSHASKNRNGCSYPRCNFCCRAIPIASCSRRYRKWAVPGRKHPNVPDIADKWPASRVDDITLAKVAKLAKLLTRALSA
jgi:hypothetical protein